MTLVSDNELKELLLRKDQSLWPALRVRTLACESPEDLLYLVRIRAEGKKRGLANKENDNPLRIAMIGGCTLTPLADWIEHCLWANGISAILFQGEYDDYSQQILSPKSTLWEFKPQVILLIPSQIRCRYTGAITDPNNQQEAEASHAARDLLTLCEKAHQKVGADILLANFVLPSGSDMGNYRARTFGSEWSFKKLVNTCLGKEAPGYVHLLDLEFLSARLGTKQASDARAWFESKQLGSPDLLFHVAKESALVVQHLRAPTKKVLVLDLDNTVWGGTIGDDGPDGIEIGDTSPRGEAFKAFQSYCLQLKNRGILLAVCSKNTYEVALEGFTQNPEMVLKRSDIVAFESNWNPKPDNLKKIARDLNVGLDSLVFVDDNPNEIEQVRQFAPEVETLLLPSDPAEFVFALQEKRWFDPKELTEEDARRTELYQTDKQRQELEASCVDTDTYLKSLHMKLAIREFHPSDLPRITQLINKSNQFNLTTKRRSQAELESLVSQQGVFAYSMRLTDKFGDHGLISVLIGHVNSGCMDIDTWLMSCRVLQRGVEFEALNELARLAMQAGCKKIRGRYLPTKKNGLVKDLLPNLGFSEVKRTSEEVHYEMDLTRHSTQSTHIDVISRAYGNTISRRSA